MNRLVIALASTLALVVLSVPTASGQAVQAPSASASNIAGAADDAAQNTADKAAAPAHVRIALRGLHDGKIDVGSKVLGVGYVRPFVANQEVRVWVAKANKEVTAKHAPIRRVPGKDQGRFKIRSKRLLEDGTYRVRAKKDASPNQDGFQAESKGAHIRYPDLDPGNHSNAVALFNDLLDKQGYYTAHGSSYGSTTGRAVLAFRKVNGMPRTQNATPGIFKQLAAGKGGFKLKYPNAGKHVEADLSRQVMVLADHGKAQHIFHISSGAPATPTIQGHFNFYRKEPGTNSHGMVNSVYFIRGYATHGYASVPTYPASHGCLRNPIPQSKFIYNWIDLGDDIWVYP